MKLKNSALIAIIIILIITISIIGVVTFIPKETKPEENITEPSKYSEKATTILKEKKLFTKVNDLDYSKTLEVMLEENTFNEKYLDAYTKIDYEEISGQCLEKDPRAIEEFNAIKNHLESKLQEKEFEISDLDLDDRKFSSAKSNQLVLRKNISNNKI